MNTEPDEFREVSLAEAMGELGLQTADALQRSIIHEGGPGMPLAEMGRLAGEMAAVVLANDLPLRPTEVSHLFADHQYARMYPMPAGQLAVTKTHKKKHFIAVVGDCTIWTDTTQKRLVGVHFFITHPGTKRVIVAHADTMFVTFHALTFDPVGIEDVPRIEAELIEPEGDPA